MPSTKKKKLEKVKTSSDSKTKRSRLDKTGRKPIDVDELRVKIHYDAPKALNDEKLCKFLGISHDTFYKLKKNNPEFSESIKHYKNISPLEVLSSFKKIATGYTFDEVKRELKKNEKTGKYEMIATEIVTKHIVPNATAGIFYLKNKMPNEFKDKIEHDVSLNDNTLEHITFVIKGKE